MKLSGQKLREHHSLSVFSLLEMVGRGTLAHFLLAVVGMGITILWLIALGSTVSLLPIGVGLLLLPVLVWVSQAGAHAMAAILTAAGIQTPDPSPLPHFALDWQSIRTVATSRNVWRVMLFTGLLLLPITVVSTIVTGPILTSAGVIISLPFISASSIDNYVLMGWPHSIWGKTVALAALLLVSLVVAPLLMRVYGAIYRLVVATEVDAEATQRRVAQLETSRRNTIGEAARQLRALERNLHDGPQQILVRTGMDLALAQRRIEEGDLDKAQQVIAEARSHTTAALEQMRSLVRGFAPPVLAERGLTDALAVLAANAPVPTSLWSILPSGWRIEPTVEQTLYFIASECIANAGKYSGASQIRLTLDEVGGQLRLTVADNGRGGAQVLPGHGLEGIGGRAGSIDAAWQLDSHEGGTTVTVICSPTLWWR